MKARRKVDVLYSAVELREMAALGTKWRCGLPEQWRDHLEIGDIRTHNLGERHRRGEGSLRIERKISSLCGRSKFNYGPLRDRATSSVL